MLSPTFTCILTSINCGVDIFVSELPSSTETVFSQPIDTICGFWRQWWIEFTVRITGRQECKRQKCNDKKTQGKQAKRNDKAKRSVLRQNTTNEAKRSVLRQNATNEAKRSVLRQNATNEAKRSVLRQNATNEAKRSVLRQNATNEAKRSVLRQNATNEAKRSVLRQNATNEANAKQEHPFKDRQNAVRKKSSNFLVSYENEVKTT
ncbi:hypothetical protein Tco_0290109 [Tanacetum coccineum]